MASGFPSDNVLISGMVSAEFPLITSFFEANIWYTIDPKELSATTGWYSADFWGHWMEFCSFQHIASSIQSVYEYISVMKPLISGAFCISISRMPLIYSAYYVDFNGTTIDIDVQHSHQHDTLYNDRNLIYNNHGRSKWHRHCTNIKHWKRNIDKKQAKKQLVTYSSPMT